MSLSVNPSKQHLKQIKAWLVKDKQNKKHSFICNWDIIEDCFNNNRLLCELHNDLPVAFFSWSVDRSVVTDPILVVSANMRKQGIGSKFMNSVELYLRDKEGILAIQLECNPNSNVGFWCKQGFVNFPPEHPIIKTGRIHVYKTLTSASPDGSSFVMPAYVHLWNKDIDYAPETESADVNIKVLLNDALLANDPVIAPASGDWKVRISVGTENPIEGEVKHVIPAEYRTLNFITIRDFKFINK
jgi:GNAT superfamily N-acetyltransferase